jgi:predicted thioesterase
MEFNIPKDLELTKKFIVKDEHIADFLGSGKVAVLSSPSMILMMEQTAMLAAQDYLPEGWITVGTRVDVSHLKATNKGEEILVTAKINAIEGKHLTFDVVAVHSGKKIGEGIHERHIVNKEKFLAKIQK